MGRGLVKEEQANPFRVIPAKRPAGLVSRDPWCIRKEEEWQVSRPAVCKDLSTAGLLARLGTILALEKWIPDKLASWLAFRDDTFKEEIVSLIVCTIL